jgi:hypothetical protein
MLAPLKRSPPPAENGNIRASYQPSLLLSVVLTIKAIVWRPIWLKQPDKVHQMEGFFPQYFKFPGPQVCSPTTASFILFIYLLNVTKIVFPLCLWKITYKYAGFQPSDYGKLFSLLSYYYPTNVQQFKMILRAGCHFTGMVGIPCSLLSRLNCRQFLQLLRLSATPCKSINQAMDSS